MKAVPYLLLAVLTLATVFGAVLGVHESAATYPGSAVGSCATYAPPGESSVPCRSVIKVTLVPFNFAHIGRVPKRDVDCLVEGLARAARRDSSHAALQRGIKTVLAGCEGHY